MRGCETRGMTKNLCRNGISIPYTTRETDHTRRESIVGVPSREVDEIWRRVNGGRVTPETIGGTSFNVVEVRIQVVRDRCGRDEKQVSGTVVHWNIYKMNKQTPDQRGRSYIRQIPKDTQNK